MYKVAVVGAGHAGVEAAVKLAEGGCAVELWSNEKVLPYFRPRLIAVAFGQTPADEIALKKAAFYADAKILLRHESVTDFNASTCLVNGQSYDGIVLAQGSTPFVPPFTGVRERLLTLWTMAEAETLRAHVAPGRRLTIIGGGVLGLESALRAAMAGMNVTVVEGCPHLVNGVLAGGAEQQLRATLEAKGIHLLTGACVTTIAAHSITLGDGNEIVDDVALCSTGARGNVTLATSAGFLADGGLKTSATLSLAPRIYAAGDMARPTEARPICAVRRATAMGTLAAANLLAELEGRPARPWIDLQLPLFMKVGDVEFHTLGETNATDVEERRIDDGTHPALWQSILFRGEQPVALRFVGTRAGFSDWEKKLVARP
ncbi:MAG: NAD(P)/FAD-dependent oxidoreductase [Kiritimatiellia bacterium]